MQIGPRVDAPVMSIVKTQLQAKLSHGYEVY